MKKIISIFLIGLTSHFLSATDMYQQDFESPDTFPFDSWDLESPSYVVGVTTNAILNLDYNSSEWLDDVAKLNPVYYLDGAKFPTAEGFPAFTTGHYLISHAYTNGDDGTGVNFISATLDETPENQYTGAPRFMNFRSFASNSSDYKGDTYQNGEVVSWYFPIYEKQRLYNEGGLIFETWFRMSIESNWTRCQTILDGPNGLVTTEVEIYGSLTDSYPVQNTWNAKEDLPDFDDEIVIRIRAKYGSETFDGPPPSVIIQDANITGPDNNITGPTDNNFTNPDNNVTSYTYFEDNIKFVTGSNLDSFVFNFSDLHSSYPAKYNDVYNDSNATTHDWANVWLADRGVAGQYIEVYEFEPDRTWNVYEFSESDLILVSDSPGAHGTGDVATYPHWAVMFHEGVDPDYTKTVMLWPVKLPATGN